MARARAGSDGDEEIIGVGDQAPALILPSSTGGQVSLGEYRGLKQVVLFFLREFT